MRSAGTLDDEPCVSKVCGKGWEERIDRHEQISQLYSGLCSTLAVKGNRVGSCPDCMQNIHARVEEMKL